MFRKRFACIAGALLIAASASAAIDWNDPRSVVEAAIAASPSLREIDANLAAARARQRGAGAMPNPMLMAGVQNQQIDLSRDPMMTMYVVGASQTFVRGERRDALQRVAQLDVKRLEHEAEFGERDGGLEVAPYYEERQRGAEEPDEEDLSSEPGLEVVLAVSPHVQSCRQIKARRLGAACGAA